MSVLFFGVRRVPRYEKDWFSGALAGWWFARQGGAGRVLLGRGLIKKDKFRSWEHRIRRPENRAITGIPGNIGNSESRCTRKTRVTDRSRHVAAAKLPRNSGIAEAVSHPGKYSDRSDRVAHT